ncbi:MAG: hypothetical protein QM743_13625 [Chitinophagaceae bacterium]
MNNFSQRSDIVNMCFMLLSCCIAILLPFELFLFSYAILGPLHYLTEISWLHDKKYYSVGRYDGWLLVGLGILVTLANLFADIFGAFSENAAYYFIGVAFLCGLLFAFVKHLFVRLAGLLLILIIVYAGIPEEGKNAESTSWLLYILFVPTLIHVYVFTALFMLYGALKSRSRLGILSVLLLIACPFLLWNILPDFSPVPVTAYGKRVYKGEVMSFAPLNQAILYLGFDVGKQPRGYASADAFWDHAIYYSREGILVMRFIAFAYTYHYLNWFAKTRIIRWHEVPKARFAAVIAIWVVSIAVYLYDYDAGIRWLFFLSIAHVIMELPLNFISLAGILRFFTGNSPAAAPVAEKQTPPLRKR